MWSKNKWYFVPGSADGFNDSGISNFKDIKFDGLAREIIQNSLDARNFESDKPVKVVFEKKLFNIDLFPGFEDYLSTVDKCIEYINDQTENAALIALKEVKNTLVKYQNDGEFPVLIVSDYNTTGLSGYQKRKGSSWSDLLKVHGNNNKNASSGGSYGIGKFAPFVFSNVRSIVYLSRNIEEGIAVQGKSILSGHVNGGTKSPRGFFGLLKEFNVDGATEKDSFPFCNSCEIPNEYIRESLGTSLYILGARIDDSWLDEIIISVLVSFFYAIFSKKLIVEVKDDNKSILIDDSNLNDLIRRDYKYLNRSMDVDQTMDFIRILNNDNSINTFEKEFELVDGQKGTMKLLLINDENVVKKSIAHIRDSGMKIETKKGFHTPVNYSGICISANKAMNDFLRKCEPPKHDNWRAENYSPSKDEKVAKRILLEFNDWERECINSLTKLNDDETLESIGMEKYFAIDLSSEDSKIRQNNITKFKPLPVVLKEEGVLKKVRPSKKDGVGLDDDLSGGIESSSHNGKAKNKKDSGGSGNVDSKSLSSKKGNKEEVKKIDIESIKSIYVDKEKCYVISFTPLENVDTCKLIFKRVGDEQSEEKKIDHLYIKDSITNNFVEIDEFSIKANQRMNFKVKFKDDERNVLEVSCYEKRRP